MADYVTAAQIELVNGTINTRIWADLDNNKNAITIAARITWAAELSTEYLNGRLSLSRYAVPFIAVPKMITHMCAILSGILLYDGRVIVTEMRDQVAPKRKEFRRLIRELLSGQLRLTHPTTGDPIECTSYTAPFVGTNPSENVGYKKYCISIPNCCHTCCCHSCICDKLNSWC
jgi:phage gp36-like protein